MNEIEKKIIMQKKVSFDLNKDKFMNNLHSRIKSSKTNRQILFTSLAMVSAIFILTITQIGAPSLKVKNHLSHNTENLIETDFWNISTDILEYDQEYFNNMAYFLFDEGFIWETVELLEQFELNREG